MGDTKLNIALFASGNGTNVQRICGYFQGNDRIRPVLVVCNNPKAFVLERAKTLGIPAAVINKRQLADPAFMLPLLREHGVSHLVLAGFLALVPPYLIKEYPERIYNIHPALLPKFGGKGMYGMHVHEAVVASGEKESGITVHVVNEDYDRGRILFQAHCKVEPGDDAEAVAQKIHLLEQTYFPAVLDYTLSGKDPQTITQTL
ncbi:MAG: phosphoribosylglycinamide formyltransferase [Bacteroides sp.]|nr:phosphoribosylglycinamide formyltransferase [Ruminococcus flavefaciens]MCM1554638.1 phosphoribosylglycinamide formyltransferase [Bacteroides sp.]